MRDAKEEDDEWVSFLIHTRSNPEMNNPSYIHMSEEAHYFLQADEMQRYWRRITNCKQHKKVKMDYPKTKACQRGKKKNFSSMTFQHNPVFFFVILFAVLEEGNLVHRFSTKARKSRISFHSPSKSNLRGVRVLTVEGLYTIDR